MNREELSQLREAIDALLKWSPAVLDEVARWLARQTVKPNGLETEVKGDGHDPHPPPVASKPSRGPRSPSIQRLADESAAKARAAEQKLIAAMKTHPDLTERALANAADMSRSSAGERLRRLAAAGAVEKGPGGRWRLTRGEARSAAGDEPRPTQPPPS